MNFKNKFFILIQSVIIITFVFSLVGCGGSSNHSNKQTISESESERIILGNEQFDLYIPMLNGKRVALYSNHTGIVGDKIFQEDGSQADITNGNSEIDKSLIQFGTDSEGNEIFYGEHIIDALIEKNVNVVAIFCPEHGFRGTEDASATIDNSVDEKTGVPILSLYADNTHHSPSSEDMAKFDTLVIDMQDVGLRYYTYYIGMYYLMNACAAANKEVIILDRPNPNGFYVDGVILQDSYKSVVGQLPIPTVHGMTWGELAQMINGEGWLESGKNSCNLKVIPCKNYSHDKKSYLIRKPSPNIKDMRAVYLYASTCFFENTLISVGRGTEFPFEVYGSPYLENVEGFNFSFTPRSIEGATNPPFENETCYGEDLRNIPIENILSAGINLDYLVRAYRAVKTKSPDESFWGTPDKNGIYWIDKLSGSDELRKMIDNGKTAQEIKASWENDIEFFKKQREPYLIYK